jgi:bifunctional UDP-N-acetylglucosamine pyrophosphorylase/glucosamine-1-phosphate N-acetyltransferase
VNNPWELAQARHLFNQHLLRHWALKGVQFLDLSSVRIECEVVLGAEVVIDAGVVLQGQTRIGDRAKIGPHVVFKDATIDSDVWIKAGTVVEEARVESFSVVGPYAHLRPGTVVGQKAKIGNFVELKKTSVGESTSIAHLSYLGDAEVGSHVNVGCGFVTCNFDGRVIEGKRKHKTVIEDHVFMGSACQAIAPVKIGKGSYIASGSTLTDDVEPGSLAIARARQVNKLDYAKKIKRFSEE